jgi:hypothetical protein
MPKLRAQIPIAFDVTPEDLDRLRQVGTFVSDLVSLLNGAVAQSTRPRSRPGIAKAKTRKKRARRRSDRS